MLWYVPQEYLQLRHEVLVNAWFQPANKIDSRQTIVSFREAKAALGVETV